MSVQDAVKRLENISSSSSSLSASSGTTAATTPEPSQSRRESYDVNASAAGANGTVDAAKVSSKLAILAGAAVPFIVPGTDEGHPIEPMLRKFDPSKDANLSIEELLARPSLPRTPSERLAMAKLKLSTGGAVANEIIAEEQAALTKADREEHLQRLRSMANQFYAKK